MDDMGDGRGVKKRNRVQERLIMHISDVQGMILVGDQVFPNLTHAENSDLVEFQFPDDMNATIDVDHGSSRHIGIVVMRLQAGNALLRG